MLFRIEKFIEADKIAESYHLKHYPNWHIYSVFDLLSIVTAEIQGVDMAATRAEVCALISWTILRSLLDYTPSEAEQWEFLNAYYEI